MHLRTTIHRICAALAALLICGCGAPDRAPQGAAARLAAAPTAPMPEAPALGDRLYAGTTGGGGQLMVLDGAQGRELPLGALSPDRATLYAVESVSAGGKPQTRVQALDVATGKTLRETSVAGAYALPTIGSDETPGGLSPNGRWLALETPPTQPGAAMPGRLVVLDTAFEKPTREVRLDGDFWFDGLSNSGDNLYLTEYLAEKQREHYRVRLYHMAAGQLDAAVIVDKSNNELVMSGVRQSALPSRDGNWLFSLYLDEEHGPFVHALNLTDQYAFCIDLPKPNGEGEAKQQLWSLAMSANGNTLYAANGGLGLVAEIGTTDMKMRRVTTLPAMKAIPGGRPAWPGGAVLAPDGKTLFVIGDGGLLAVDTGDPKQYRQLLQSRALRGVALSADGERLYAVDGARGTIVQANPASGAIVAEVAGAGALSGLLWAEERA
jgi:hypothetical protein